MGGGEEPALMQIKIVSKPAEIETQGHSHFEGQYNDETTIRSVLTYRYVIQL